MSQNYIILSICFVPSLITIIMKDARDLLESFPIFEIFDLEVSQRKAWLPQASPHTPLQPKVTAAQYNLLQIRNTRRHKYTNRNFFLAISNDKRCVKKIFNLELYRANMLVHSFILSFRWTISLENLIFATSTARDSGINNTAMCIRLNVKIIHLFV